MIIMFSPLGNGLKKFNRRSMSIRELMIYVLKNFFESAY
jgi:hypothetical protein